MTIRNESIDVKDLLIHVWSKKKQYMVTIAIATTLSLAFLLTKENMYTSEILLIPIKKDSSGNVLQGLSGQFGGLANLAGVNLGVTDDNEGIIAKQTLTSRAFLVELIRGNHLEPLVYAADGFRNGIVVFDESLYDTANEKWNSEKLDGKDTPTDTDLYEKITSFYSVVENPENGTLRLSFEHVSPVFARDFLSLVFSEINKKMRVRALDRSESRLDYLTRESASSTAASVRQVLAQLIESEVNKRVLIDTEPNYSFDIVDPAFIPEEKSSPMRALILILMLAGTSVLFLAYCGLSFLFKEYSK